jgi:hypothetical protein
MQVFFDVHHTPTNTEGENNIENDFRHWDADRPQPCTITTHIGGLFAFAQIRETGQPRWHRQWITVCRITAYPRLRYFSKMPIRNWKNRNLLNRVTINKSII